MNINILRVGKKELASFNSFRRSRYREWCALTAQGTSTRKQERSAKVTRCIKLITGVGKKIHAEFWFIYVVIIYSSLVGWLHPYALSESHSVASGRFFHLHCTDANEKCKWRKMERSLRIEILCNYGNMRREWAISEFKGKNVCGSKISILSWRRLGLCGRRALTLHVRMKCTPPKWMQTKYFAGRNDCRKSVLFAGSLILLWKFSSILMDSVLALHLGICGTPNTAHHRQYSACASSVWDVS